MHLKLDLQYRIEMASIIAWPIALLDNEYSRTVT